MENNIYIEKYLKQLKNAKNDYTLIAIIEKIYTDGFEDGYNEKN